MISKDMERLGSHRSAIREIFEYSKMRAGQIGADNVFDFSIGNPSVKTPDSVTETMINLLKNEDPVKLHGYTSAQGDLSVRQAMAKALESDTGFPADADLIYMTCGAAASLTITLGAILNEGDEVVVPAPYFPEYKVFVESSGGVFVPVKCKEKTFALDFESLNKAITAKTKAVIINSPNNPTGAVITEEEMIKLSAMLKSSQEKFGTEIYLISDEPYRKLIYSGSVPEAACYYDRTVICYSFSKSLSLPGDRIGYICVSHKMDNAKNVYYAVCGAGRALGFVCAPSLLQFTVANCAGDTADLSVYRKNRELLYNSLIEMGYEAVYPEGAFYLFLKALEDDANAFCEKAKKYELLLVPSNGFGVEGYVRIAYCTSTEMIERSLSAFKKLIDSYKR